MMVCSGVRLAGVPDCPGCLAQVWLAEPLRGHSNGTDDLVIENRAGRGWQCFVDRLGPFRHRDIWHRWREAGGDTFQLFTVAQQA